MQPELVRAARHGAQLQKRRFFRPLQHAVLRQRPLPPLVDHADKAAAAGLIDRQVDLPLAQRRLTENGGSRTLKKLMIDRKIPAAERDALAVIADRSGVIAVQDIGMDLSRRPGNGVRLEIKIERN